MARDALGLPQIARVKAGLRRAIFSLKLVNKFGNGFDSFDCANALARTPNILPRFGLGIAARTEVHRARIADRQVIRVHSGRLDGGAKIVAVDPGKEVGIDDPVGLRFDDGVLVSLVGVGFLRSDPRAADVGEVRPHRLRRQHRVQVHQSGTRQDPLGRDMAEAAVLAKGGRDAFYKGALLAKKQYPPKGSQRVGLIHMSDEFKQWFETVKQSQKMPDRIPERIAKHFMFATILDDQGGFRFTKLPPGEYLLIADFSYKETVTRSEVTGRTDVFVGNQHIGSNDQVAYWFEDVKKNTTFSKTVHLKDGEAMQVTLDKSMLGCFFICR